MTGKCYTEIVGELMFVCALGCGLGQIHLLFVQFEIIEIHSPNKEIQNNYITAVRQNFAMI